MTIREVTWFIPVSRATLMRWAARGVIATVHIGPRVVLWSRLDVDAWLDRNEPEWKRWRKKERAKEVFAMQHSGTAWSADGPR